MRIQLPISVFSLILLSCFSASAQIDKGVISGEVADSQSAALPGAKVELEPKVQPVVSNGQGLFTLVGVNPGTYTITISYVGFKPYTGTVIVVAGKTANVQAVLHVATANEEVIVTADRPHGEAEAINRTLAAENICKCFRPSDCFAAQRQYCRRAGPHGLSDDRA